MSAPIQFVSNAVSALFHTAVDDDAQASGADDPWRADGNAADPVGAGKPNLPAPAMWFDTAKGLLWTAVPPGLLVPLRDGPASASTGTRSPNTIPNDRQRAQDALKAGMTPPASHPRMQHVKDVQERLKKEGLPASADGVRVYVVGDRDDHGAMVVRTIAGSAGLAQGAEVELSEKMPDPGTARLPDEEARMEHALANLSVKMGDANSQQLKMWAIDSLEAAFTQPKAELDYLVAHAPKDGQTKIVNMSWGNSEDALVAQATQAALSHPDSPLVQELDRQRALRDLPKLDLKKPEAREELRHFVAGLIHQALASPEGAKRLQTARTEAAAAVAKAREAGFLPIAAAGNFFEPTRTGPRGLSNENLVATIPGVLSVGSVKLDSATRNGNDAMGESSSTGAAVSAPGVDVPVGIDARTGGIKNVSGTSFAAPYAASVAALMVKANPNITPAQIEKILQSPAVAKDVKGTSRDGAGTIDPVAAVRAAKALLHAGEPRRHTSDHLDQAVKRAGYEALRGLLPATSAAYKATVRLISDDRFVELDVATQKNLLAGLAAGKSDALAQDVTKLVASKEFNELGPAARARFAQTFIGLAAPDRAAAMALLRRPDIAMLPTALKDALTAAAAKMPADKNTVDTLVTRANDPAFKKLPADVQAAFFRAFEHQNDGIELDGSPQSRKHLVDFVDSAAFKQLDATAQSRWMGALASADPVVRERSYERLAAAIERTAKQPDAAKAGELSSRAGALDADQTVRTDRKELPGASKELAQISDPRAEQRSVFFAADGRGIDPKKADVLVHTVTIDGQAIEVVYPRPKPAGMPSIDLIAKGLAGLPATERAAVTQVIVDPRMKDFMQAAGAKEGRPNRVFMGGEGPDNQREMTAILSHEAAHLLSADRFKADPALRTRWEAAIRDDDHRVSNYAANSLQEDVAETVALYYQVKGTPDEAVMKRDFPNRYAVVKELLGER